MSKLLNFTGKLGNKRLRLEKIWLLGQDQLCLVQLQL